MDAPERHVPERPCFIHQYVIHCIIESNCFTATNHLKARPKA